MWIPSPETRARVQQNMRDKKEKEKLRIQELVDRHAQVDEYCQNLNVCCDTNNQGVKKPNYWEEATPEVCRVKLLNCDTHKTNQAQANADYVKWTSELAVEIAQDPIRQSYFIARMNQ